MTEIAAQLDRELKVLPPEMAASVERLVRDALEMAHAVPSPEREESSGIEAQRRHVDQCLALAAEMDWSEFERPEQGVSEVRNDE
jgi:hypothetical protein